MPLKSEKHETNQLTSHSVKKQIGTKTNDRTERTQRSVLEKFTDEQLAEFRELFDMFDKDNQGILTPQTLVLVMKSVGQTPTEADMIDLMRDMDLDNSGTIDFYEFVNIISHRMYLNETNQEIRQAFDLFDRNQDGLITLEELKSTVEKHLKMSINDFDARQMIELADRSNRGHVSFEDFLHAAVCGNEKKGNSTSTYPSVNTQGSIS